MSESTGLYEWFFGPGIGPIVRNLLILFVCLCVIFQYRRQKI